MTLDQETINAQLKLLASHRQRLALLLQQQARLGAYTPPHVVIDIQEAQSAIRRIKEQLRADGVPVEDEPNDDVRLDVIDSPSRLTLQEQRNRSRMLNKVETIWIKGVLEQSLYQVARIELGLEFDPNAVIHPWESIIQWPNQPNQSIPPGKPVIEVFDALDDELLILGAPGGGKTTLLLELARDLIARARQNESHPIPVVFNLSTWAARRQPLNEWLAGELNQRYGVPEKQAQEWVNANAVLPLLDGLDEVAAEHRDACVEAINNFRTAYGFVQRAVCSRSADYEALTTKLRLQGAIVVQPLTQQQVDDYLKRIGRPLEEVGAALRDDAMLWELMDNPLMLSVVALAYKDKPAGKLRASGTAEERRTQLFDDYIAAMFKRRRRTKRYTHQQTTDWLSWLAGQMVQHNLTVFYIERMQPEWIPNRQYRKLYSVLVGLITGIGSGLFGGIIGYLVMGLIIERGSEMALRVISGLGGTTGFGSICGFFAFLVVGLGVAWRSRIVHIAAVDDLEWSWSSLKRDFVNRMLSVWNIRMFVMLVGGLIMGLIIAPISGLSIGLVSGLVIGLGGGLSSLLTTGLSSGLVNSELIDTRTRPNHGIWLSAKSALKGGAINGLVFGPGGGLVVGPLVSLVIGQLGWLNGGMLDWLSFGLVFGLLVGMGYALLGGLLYCGITTVIQHYILRYLLYRNGSLPLRLVPFLDYCAERIFLRKVGGGYIFVHRLLMEHFAGLEQGTTE